MIFNILKFRRKDRENLCLFGAEVKQNVISSEILFGASILKARWPVMMYFF